ncbi:MAG: uroporphyrinogen decarboxylase family protein [Spirochaetota bacterium]
MTAGERIHTALSGGTPDRVPFVPKIWIDLAAILLGEDMLEVIGNPQRALEITARAAVELGLDGARIFNIPPRRLERNSAGSAVEIDSRGRMLGRIDEAGGFATHLDDPRSVDLGDPFFSAWAQFRCSQEAIVRNHDDIAALAVPDASFWQSSGFRSMTMGAIRKYGDRTALFGDLGSATVSFCIALRGMERTLYDFIDEPALVHALMDKGAAIAIAKARFLLGLGLKVLRLNDSAGTMTLISPALWREFVFPRFRDIASAVKSIDPAARIYCHICGDVRPIAKDLVEAGIDCIGPLDPLGGSTPAALRRLVGPKQALMGGIDTMSFLRSSATQIAAEARACVLEGGALGAFTLGSGCALPRGSRRENIEAARDLALSTSYVNDELVCADFHHKEAS